MHHSFVHYLFYKPFQTLSQFSPEGTKKTLADYFPGIAKDVYPVGRLDYDSEGLLFLTNDKTLNHRLLHPSFIHERQYWVQVEGIPKEDDLAQLRKGVFISIKGKSYCTRPAKVSLMAPPDLPERLPPVRFRKHIPTSWISLMLVEGKNRQVRRMTAAVGLPTLRLIRYSIGSVTLENMKPGDFLPFATERIPELFHHQASR